MSDIQETGIVSVGERLNSTHRRSRTPGRDRVTNQSNSEDLPLEQLELDSIDSQTPRAQSSVLAASTHTVQTTHQQGPQSDPPGLLSKPHASSENASPPIIGSIDQSAGFNNGISEVGGDELPQPVALPGKVGIIYPGSTTIYPALFPVSNTESNIPSPEYSARDPNGETAASANKSVPISRRHRSSSRSTLCESSNLSRQSLDKPPELATEPLDPEGFTPEERTEHIRSVRHRKTLKIVLFTRLLLRTVVIAITLIALILSAIVLYHFHEAKKTHTLPEVVSNRPTSALAGFGAITTLISLVLLLLCLFIPRLRRVNTLSNTIFAAISIIGVASWVCGCIYLYDGRRTGRNLWYYTCKAAKVYGTEEVDEGISSSGPDPEDAGNARMVHMCHMTNGAWRLAIVASVIEIFTFLNVLAALVVVNGRSRWSLPKWRGRRTRS